MSIVSTVIKSAMTDGNRRIYLYECTDDMGGKHPYGLVNTIDPAFDEEAHKTIVATKVAAALAEQEANEVLG